METSNSDIGGGTVKSTLNYQINNELAQQLVDVCRQYAGDLHQVVRDLLFKTHVAPAPLQNLARRIQLEIDAELLAALMPDAEWSLENCLSANEWRSEPVVYATGIQSAALLAYAAPGMFGWSDRIELLVIAALLQDVGLLLLERRYGLPANQLAIDEPAAYRQHPASSAALAGALNDYAVDLPRLIAQHHERNDGTGYPAGEKADRLAAPSRLLSVAVRFVELVNDVAVRGCPGDDKQDRQEIRHFAAALLQREAAQGELDARLTASFLRQLDLAVPTPPRLGRHFRLSGLSGKRFRRDSAGSVTAEDGLPANAVAAPHRQLPVTDNRLAASPEERAQR